MAAANTFTQISTTTLSTSATTVTISLPTSTYSDLHIAARLKSSTAGTGTYTARMRFNENTELKYATFESYGSGTATPGTANYINESSLRLEDIPAADNTSVFSNIYVDILNYRESTKYKTVLIKNDSERNSGGLTNLNVALWYPTTQAAITSVTFLLSSGDIVAGSSIDIYGITAA